MIYFVPFYIWLLYQRIDDIFITVVFSVMLINVLLPRFVPLRIEYRGSSMMIQRPRSFITFEVYIFIFSFFEPTIYTISNNLYISPIMGNKVESSHLIEYFICSCLFLHGQSYIYHTHKQIDVGELHMLYHIA